MERGFSRLEDVILDEDFPSLDLALRRGRHIDRDDGALYALLLEAQAHLEALYRRYGCELVQRSDGYFYLLPTGDQLPRRQLLASDMRVGQALALLYLDPGSVERGGLVTREQVIEQLVNALGSDALIGAFLPKRRRYDEQVAQRQVRAKIGEAIRRLAGLGFVALEADEQLRLRPSLMRFAEPVRGLAAPAEALAKLVAQGEVALEQELEGDATSADGEDDAEADDEASRVRDSEAEPFAEVEAEAESLGMRGRDEPFAEPEDERLEVPGIDEPFSEPEDEPLDIPGVEDEPFAEPEDEPLELGEVDDEPFAEAPDKLRRVDEEDTA